MRVRACACVRVRVCACARACVCVRAFVLVCVCERERERELCNIECVREKLSGEYNNNNKPHTHTDRNSETNTHL